MYLGSIIVNMLYMFMYLVNNITFIIVMVMSCDMVSGTISMFYLLCKTIVIINISKFIYFSYIVSIISVNCIVPINTNIINTNILCFLYIMRYVFYSYWKHQLKIG